MAAKKKRRAVDACSIAGKRYRVVLVERRSKKTKKKRAGKKRAPVLPRRRGNTAPGMVVPGPAKLTRAEFARAVEHATIEAPPWHGNSDKSLLHDVFVVAELELPGWSFDDFKARLRVERFPLDAIDLVDILSPERRRQNDFFGQGPYAIRKRVRLA